LTICWCWRRRRECLCWAAVIAGPIPYGCTLMYGRYLIYALLDLRTSEVRYVGRSSAGLRRPMKHGHSSSWTEDYRSRWLRGLFAAGSAFRVVVLESLASAAALDEAERRWIAQGRAIGWRLTNVTDGGEGGNGRVWTSEQRARHSARLRGIPKSPEHRAALAKSLTGTRASDATREKQSAAAKRRAADPSEHDRLATLRLGATNSPAARAKLRAANLGLAHSPERRATNARVRTGIPLPDHVKAKMSESQRRAWKRRRSASRASSPR
jgi:hypothetical protein